MIAQRIVWVISKVTTEAINAVIHEFDVLIAMLSFILVIMLVAVVIAHGSLTFYQRYHSRVPFSL